MSGGTGADTFFVDNAGDRILESGGRSTISLDAVVSSISWTITAAYSEQIEYLILGGTAAIHGTGSARNDILDGNIASNSLVGRAGDDDIFGAAGKDHLFGGDGNDILEGGLGNDSLTGGQGRDHFVFGEGRDLVTDFVVNTDRLTFDRSLLGGVPDSDDDILRFGRIRNGDAVFDFGDGHVLTLDGVTSLSALRGELYYL